MRAEDGLWQKTDAKAREHHLHRHGRIVAVAGHIRRKAAALALLHQKVPQFTIQVQHPDD